jgi:phenylpyruvate tautomerase PptA (4-oxalocrotonate tautomerase family)
VPFIQIDLPRDPSADDFRSFADDVANLFAGVMQTTTAGVTVAVRELGRNRVLRGGPDGARPTVAIRCDIRRGRPTEQRDAFAIGLADLVERRAAELGAAEVVVYVNEGAGAWIYEDRSPNAEWSPAEAGQPDR